MATKNINVPNITDITGNDDGFPDWNGSYDDPFSVLSDAVDKMSLSCEDNSNARYPLTSSLNDRSRDRNPHASNAFVYHKVYEFDMRGRVNKLIKGKETYIDAHVNVLRSRIASKYNVGEELVVFMNESVNGIIRMFSCVAIIDELGVSNLTLYIRMDPEDKHSYKCINTPRETTVEALLTVIGNSQPVLLFTSGIRLSTGSLSIQHIESGSEIDICPIKTKTIKCLYRAYSRFEHIYITECRTTDSIHELKQKIRQTIRGVSKDSMPVPENIVSSYMWLTLGNRIYQDTEYVGFLTSDDESSDISGSENLEYFDFVIHFQAPECIPVFVAYKSGESRTSSVETVVIPHDASSAQLREHVSKLLHWTPNGLKMIVNGKKLPVIDNMSLFPEFKLRCVIYASIRRPITVNVHVYDKIVQISVMKLDQILLLKCKLAAQIKKPPILLKLLLGEQEPDDYHRIEQKNIKDHSDIFAEVVEDRIMISIRKRKTPITHVIIDGSTKRSIRYLKNFYKHTIKLCKNLDIELHKFNSSARLHDDMYLGDSQITHKETLVATEKPNCEFRNIKTIFEVLERGEARIRCGMICNGKIFYGHESMNESGDVEEDGLDQEYILPSPCKYIRQAYPFELEEFEIHTLEDFVTLPVCVVPPAITDLVPCRHVKHRHLSNRSRIDTMAMQHSVTIGAYLHCLQDPPGVVSNRELDSLSKQLPGSNWQCFVRSIGVPHAVVAKHVESNPRNVTESIYQCLHSWKLSKGTDALRNTLQRCLCENELRLISEVVFGCYDTI